MNKIFENKKVLGVRIDTTSVNEQKNYYQGLVKENPTYIDGYIELARISAFLGDKDSERSYLKTAYNINPNDRDVNNMLSIIGE